MKETYPDLHHLFNNAWYSLNSDTIIKMNQLSERGELNNVVIGLEKQCFAIALMEDSSDLKYRLYYINGANELMGEMLELTIKMKWRDELVLFFAHYLADHYKEVDFIDVFNTYQRQTRGMLEAKGYFTVTTSEIEKHQNQNPVIFAPKHRGIVFLKDVRKEVLYKEFFENNISKTFKNDTDYVYLMLNKRNSSIKIGRSKKPLFREKTLQSEEPLVEVIAIWEAPNFVERELHNLFASNRKRGEWFDLSFKDLKKIKEHMASYK